MKRASYVGAQIARENLLKNWLLNWAFALSSFPSLLLEVFIRKDFGERYFTLFSAISAAVILAFFPSILSSVFDFFQTTKARPHDMFGMISQQQDQNSSYWMHWGTWYLFIVLFLFFAYRRHLEQRAGKSAYSFERMSTYRGTVNSFFTSMRWQGKPFSLRMIETVLEPVGFLIAGIFLVLMQQNLGYLLIISSILYGVGYEASYVSGDNYILDKIDEIISNENIEAAFVKLEKADQTKGVTVRARVPEDEDARRKILPLIMEEDEPTEVR